MKCDVLVDLRRSVQVKDVKLMDDLFAAFGRSATTQLKGNNEKVTYRCFQRQERRNLH